MRITIVGGTFTVLHRGHRTLLREACRDSDKVIVGLSTDTFSSATKDYDTVPYEIRERNLMQFFSEINCSAEIRPLSQRSGTAAEDPSFGRIVVSEETHDVALSINNERKRKGLDPLTIDTVPMELSDDFFPVSSRRVLRKEIDPDGKRLVPLSVVISSENRLKREAVEKFFRSSGVEITLLINTDYRTPEQPFGEDITEMALKRAQSATGEYDYSIGIEAGLIYDRTAKCFMDIHACVVLDRYGNITTGLSSGFKVPDYLADIVRSGVDLSEAYEAAHGKADIGKNEGIVGVFSKGTLTRLELVEESLRNAFIPRRSPGAYGLLYSE